jgi:uncharacterized phage-associated protein
MKMSEKRLPSHLQAELERLSLLADEEIQTEDIPEITDFSSFRRGRYSEPSLIERNVDIRALANWFLARFKATNRKVTNLSLNKILYIAIERGIIEKGILFSPAKIEAWKHGPVFREIYHASKHEGREEIKDDFKKFDLATRQFVTAKANLSVDDAAFLESVFSDYGSLPAGKLVDLTHEVGSPWHVVWSNGRNVNFGMEITKQLILSRAKGPRSDGEKQGN